MLYFTYLVKKLRKESEELHCLPPSAMFAIWWTGCANGSKSGPSVSGWKHSGSLSTNSSRNPSPASMMVTRCADSDVAYSAGR